MQIAKALGARVTAVCSSRNVEMVRALGADEVLDYTQQDFGAGGARFDVMLDLVGNRSLSDCRSVLTPEGAYVPCSGGGGDWVGPFVRILGGLISSLFTSRKSDVQTPTATISSQGLIEAGGEARHRAQLRLRRVAEALRHVGEASPGADRHVSRASTH